jgi:hypothetical protein
MRTQAMDFYWKRSGLRWVVISEERCDGDDHWGNRQVLFACWRQKTASRVCLLIFEAYGLGCDVGRGRAAFTPAVRETP